MENRETLSPSTRVAVVLAGALQGVICYVITWYIEYAKLPSDTLWLMCVVPATVVMTTTLSLVIQKAIFVAVTRDDRRGSRGYGRLV